MNTLEMSLCLFILLSVFVGYLVIRLAPPHDPFADWPKPRGEERKSAAPLSNKEKTFITMVTIVGLLAVIVLAAGTT
jgi:hypothetical protein